MMKITESYGTWELDNGMTLESDEYIPCGAWEDEWNEELWDGRIPDDAVSYTIYDADGNEYDGGIMGFYSDDTIEVFDDWLGLAHGVHLVTQTF